MVRGLVFEALYDPGIANDENAAFALLIEALDDIPVKVESPNGRKRLRRERPLAR